MLLFSQFTSMLALIQESLRTADIDHVLLTGGTRDRETPIKRFQAGKVPLFLISLKAGGVGLNLTAIEEKIEVLKTRKRDLAAGLFDPDGASALDLTEADIQDLFARG